MDDDDGIVVTGKEGVKIFMKECRFLAGGPAVTEIVI